MSSFINTSSNPAVATVKKGGDPDAKKEAQKKEKEAPRAKKPALSYPAEPIFLKTYRRRQIVHVCMRKHCAGLPRTLTEIREDARLRVVALLDTRLRMPVGVLVELPEGAGHEVWPLLDRKTLVEVDGLAD